MSRPRVYARVELPPLIEKFQNSWERIEKVIAATVQTQVGLRFNEEGAHNGHEKWAPLKMRQGQILSLTGTLRKSMSPDGEKGVAGPQGFVRGRGSVADMVVEVGTTLLYAGVHDKGAVIVPKNKQALRYVNPSNGKYVFSKKSVIPARPYTDLNYRDEDEIAETLANLIAQILSEAQP